MAYIYYIHLENESLSGSVDSFGTRTPQQLDIKILNNKRGHDFQQSMQNIRLKFCVHLYFWCKCLWVNIFWWMTKNLENVRAEGKFRFTYKMSCWHFNRSRNQMKKLIHWTLNIFNFWISNWKDPTHHVSQADVQEHSSCDGKDGVWCKAASEQNAEDEAQVAGQGWQQVEEDGLWDAHPGVQQDDKVACREGSGGATTQGSNHKHW